MSRVIDDGEQRDPRAQAKKNAAARAVTLVESGMTVGLGAGSTMLYVAHLLREEVTRRRLRDLSLTVASPAMEALLAELGLKALPLGDTPDLDLTIDGADEVDGELNLIKGGGGALLREKMLSQASRRVAIVVDDSKPSPQIGTKRAVPVEVIPFGLGTQVRFLKLLGAHVTLREFGGVPFVTPDGHFILDGYFGPIDDPAALAGALERRAGVVEHGLFLGLVTDLFVAGEAQVRHERIDREVRQR